MQTFKTNSKYFIIAALTLGIMGGVFAQVSIPTGLTNAVQYIRDTLWTTDGTNAGTVNVKINPNNIYVRTGFLTDGTGWNSKALGVDSSGNVVYVNANAINTPFFNLAGNYIPKINQAGNDLELSTMFQGTLGDISVGHINPLAKMHIQGDFRVDTISGSLMQYTYSTGGAQVIGAVTAPDPSQLCSCDTTTNALNCTTPSFTTGLVQGAGQFCVDITFSGGGTRNYRVYMQNTTNINQGAFIVTGNKVGVMTLTPQATLDVNGNVMIANIPQNLAPTQVLVPGPNGEVQYAAFPAGSAGEINTASNLGTGARVFSVKIGANLTFRSIIGAGITTVSEQSNTITINTPAQTLTLNGNTLSISSGNSVILPAGSSANAWNLTGNTGTLAGVNFIGTIDNIALDFRTNNNLMGRLFTNGSIQRGVSNTIMISSNNATIAGGTNNIIGASSNGAAIGGGTANIMGAGSINSTIGGGQQNAISLSAQDAATIAGGKQNTISAGYATIAGGWLNTAAGVSSFIGGGYQNIASGQNSSIIGGQSNSAGGSFSTVAGGQNNQSLGNHSFAAGQNAVASGINSFVWSDGTASGSSLLNNEFMVNADHVVIGDIQDYEPRYHWAYRNNVFKTYFPGTVGVNDITIYTGRAFNFTAMTFTQGSDSRLKTGVTYANDRNDSGINIIKSLLPVKFLRANNEYTENGGFDYNDIHYGFIAQEVESTIPDIIGEFDGSKIGFQSGEGRMYFKSIDTTEIIPILVQAVKEQQAIIEDLEFRLSNLEGGPVQ